MMGQYHFKFSRKKGFRLAEMHKAKIRKAWKHISSIEYLSRGAAENEEFFFYSLFHNASLRRSRKNK